MSGKRYKMYVTNVQNTCNDIGWHIKSGTYMLCADRTIGEFPKWLASIIAVKGGHVEYLNILFNMTILHCNDQG